MGFDLVWAEGNIEDVESDISAKVARDLRSSLKDKQKQIRWKDNMAELKRRFQDMFKLNGLTVAEIRFSSMSAEYRVLCVVIPDDKSVVLYEVVPKKGSYQERALRNMRKNSEEIEKFIRRDVL